MGYLTNTTMTDLKTLQEEIEQIESLIKVVSDTDILDTPDVEDFYRAEDSIINGSHIDNARNALALRGKIKLLFEKANTLGMMKGVEVVERINEIVVEKLNKLKNK